MRSHLGIFVPEWLLFFGARRNFLKKLDKKVSKSVKFFKNLGEQIKNVNLQIFRQVAMLYRFILLCFVFR